MVGNLSVCLFIGSSPRGRGKPNHGHSLGKPNRLIPAWAGKTMLATKRAARSTAHPRVGGENLDKQRHARDRRGSSPRGRGKHDRLHPSRGPRGLIPAWAGKTRVPIMGRIMGRAHPRVGGENRSAATPIRSFVGSSPRGRGKRRRGPALRRQEGLIPAWAGKTLIRASVSSAVAAHPRVGGENGLPWCARAGTAGSSPRGRGKPDRSDRGRYWRGLIPAWAGKTIVARLV